MAANPQQTPLLQQAPPPSTAEKAKKVCIKGCGGCCVTLFILVWIVQGCCYWYGLNFGCSASKLEGYKFPGAEAGEKFTKEENLVPRIALLAERDPSKYGASFDVIPSNIASAVSEAPVGVWWRTWGPLFNTYIYEDVHASKTIIYMRRNMLRLGLSHRIGRCDGKDEGYTLNEGTFWFSNKIRALFGLNQAQTYHLYKGSEFIGLVQETNRGTPSLTVGAEDGTEMGSGVLQSRHFHGSKDEWLTKTEKGSDIPFYVTESIAALAAFQLLDVKTKSSKKPDFTPSDYGRDAPNKLMLLADSDTSIFANVSLPYSEVRASEDMLESTSKDDADTVIAHLENV